MPVFAQTNEEDPGVTPDSPFYGLDRAIERIQLALTQNRAERAKMGLQFAYERLREIRAMEKVNRTELADKVDEDYDEQMEQVNEEIEELGNETNVTDVMRLRAELWIQSLEQKMEQARNRIQQEEAKGNDGALAQTALDGVESLYESAKQEYALGNYEKAWQILHNIKVIANRVKRGVLFQEREKVQEAQGINKKLEEAKTLAQSSGPSGNQSQAGSQGNCANC